MRVCVFFLVLAVLLCSVWPSQAYISNGQYYFDYCPAFELPAGFTLGTCPSTGILARGSSCRVELEAGSHLSNGTLEITCNFFFPFIEGLPTANGRAVIVGPHYPNMKYPVSVAYDSTVGCTVFPDMVIPQGKTRYAFTADANWQGVICAFQYDGVSSYSKSFNCAKTKQGDFWMFRNEVYLNNPSYYTVDYPDLNIWDNSFVLGFCLVSGSIPYVVEPGVSPNILQWATTSSNPHLDTNNAHFATYRTYPISITIINETDCVMRSWPYGSTDAPLFDNCAQVASESTCNVTCPTGYVVQGNPQLRCSYGYFQVSDPTPTCVADWAYSPVNYYVFGQGSTDTRPNGAGFPPATQHYCTISLVPTKASGYLAEIRVWAESADPIIFQTYTRVTSNLQNDYTFHVENSYTVYPSIPYQNIFNFNITNSWFIPKNSYLGFCSPYLNSIAKRSSFSSTNQYVQFTYMESKNSGGTYTSAQLQNQGTYITAEYGFEYSIDIDGTAFGRCSQLTWDIPNGNYGNCSGVWPWEQCTIACDSGYSVVGDAYLDCPYGNNTYRGAQVCAKTNCDGSQTLPQYGAIGNCSNVPLGLQCMYECRSGFTKVSTGLSSCNLQGVMTVRQTCLPPPCSLQPTSLPAHAESIGDCTNVPTLSSCSIVCQANYTASPSSTQCYFGSFQSVQSCVGAPCDGRSQIPVNGSVGTCTSVASGASCNYACKSGFTLVGAPATCDMGTLTSQQVCLPKPCTGIAPINGNIGNCASVPSGQNCSYACAADYVIKGNPLRCNLGVLSGNQTCVHLTCFGDTTIPQFGTIGNCSSVDSGKFCSYQCSSGFDLNGPPSLCNGTTMLTTQTCTPKNCTLTLGAHMDWGSCQSSITNGTQCSINCLSPYLPSSFPVSCYRGSNLYSVPTCHLPQSCSIVLSRGLSLGSCSSPLSSNTSCTLALNSSYVLANGSLAIKCFDGQLTLPTASPKPCQFPAASTTQHLAQNSCPAANSNLASGNTCTMACATGYETSASLTFSCSFGVLTGNISSSCTPKPCSISSAVAPVTAGTCSSNVLPSGESCVFGCVAGYSVKSLALSTVTCTLGVTNSYQPSCVPSPCIFPTASANSATGNCTVASGIASGVSCQVGCVSGYVVSELTPNTVFSCSLGVLQGQWPVCELAQPCVLPTEWDTGLLPGNCTALSIPSSTMCKLAVAAGYYISTGSLVLSCLNGILSSPPEVLGIPCSLPYIAVDSNVVAGTCSVSQNSILSGPDYTCQTACAEGYYAVGSGQFQCNLGELSGQFPSCKPFSCRIPYSLPTGLAFRTCLAGAKLEYGASCLIKLAYGYRLYSGSLTLSCGGDGVLSDLPIAVESWDPVLVSGTCDLSSNWATNTPITWSDLPRTGAPACDHSAQYSMIGWLFVPCGPNNQSMRLQLTCQYNAMLQISTTVTVQGSCISPTRMNVLNQNSDINQLGTVSCPNDYAVVSLRVQHCGDGVQWSIGCQPVFQPAPLVGSYALPQYNNYIGSTPFNIPAQSFSSLMGLTQTLFTPCDYTRYNYMTGVGYTLDTRYTRPTNFMVKQYTSCIEFENSVLSLAAAPLEFYGAHISDRPYLNDYDIPQCIALKGVYIRSSGNVTVFKFHARNIGTIVFQTYLMKEDIKPDHPKLQYEVQGSFSYEVTHTGLNYIVVPDEMQWYVTPDHVFGFCYKNTPIIPYELITTTGGSGYTTEFDGAEVQVGNQAGGGGFNVIDYLTAYYAVQVGVSPISPHVTFGYRAISRASVDSSTDGTCTLLTKPVITVKGLIESFTFYSHINRGQLFLQTYRPVGGSWVLQGSIEVPTVFSGLQTFQVPFNNSWDVLPGDVMAHCFTKDSLVYDDMTDITDNLVYKQYLANTPTWKSYVGAIQRTVGGDVLGVADTSSANNHRQYSMQISVTAVSACEPVASKPAAGGHGTVVCDALKCTLDCGEGWASVKPYQYCNYDGTWTNQGICVQLENTPLQVSYDVADISPYSLQLSWQEPISGYLIPPLVHYEIKHQFVFPNYIDDFDNRQLAGLGGVNGSVIISPEFTTYQLRLDTNSMIEHVTVDLSIRNVFTAGHSQWSPPTRVTLSCACNAYIAKRASLDAVIYGYPIDLIVSQQLSTNQLQLSFLPNSMCADEYDVAIKAVDNTPLKIASIAVTQPHVENSETCNYLKRQLSNLAALSYPAYGRLLRVCLSPRPRGVTFASQSQYGTKAAENGRLPPYSVCADFTPSFAVTISGNVKTPVTPLAPISVAVPNIRVNLTIVDSIRFLPVNVKLADGSIGHVTTTVISDNNGRFVATLSSPSLYLQNYAVLVSPWKTEISASGASYSHTFTLADDQSKKVYQGIVAHGDYITGVNFYDNSQIAISGSINLSGGITSVQSAAHAFHTSAVPNGLLYGSNAFQGCGVPGITVTAYASSDTAFKTPLSVTSATGADGTFLLNVPLFTDVVLVPKSSASTNHVFSPATQLIHVEQSSIVVDPFYDITTSSFKLTAFGGSKCHFHIGSFVPTLYLPSCGASAHIALPMFDDLGYNYIVPALHYTIRLFDPHNSLSGLQQTDSDGSILPGDYLYGDVFTWSAAYPEDDLDLFVAASYNAIDYIYQAPTIIDPIKSLDCTDPLAPVTNNQYDYIYANSLNLVQFQLSQAYGYVSTTGLNRVLTCTQVDASVDILDDVTNAGQQLHPLHPTCTTGQHICTITPLVTLSSVATYIFNAGDVELNTHTDSTQPSNHLLPAYSRSILYRLSGSVSPYKSLNYVLLGTSAEDGSLTLTYPPQDPLYILRDPPGGASFASLSTSTSISTSSKMSTKSTDTTNIKHEISAGLDLVNTMCVGLLIEQCVENLKLEVDYKHSWTTEDSSSDSSTHTNSDEHSFATTITTSVDPNMIDGVGDLFLTVSGTYTLSINKEIIGSVSTVSLNGVNTKVCTTIMKPTLQWKKDPTNTYQWISAYDVKNVVQHDLNLANEIILAEFQAVDYADLLVKDTTGNQAAAFNNNEIAIRNWDKMLKYNDDLKANAVPWPDFFNSMSALNSNGGSSSASSTASTSLLTKAKQAALDGVNVDVTVSDPLDFPNGDNLASSKSFGIQANGQVGSITFFGDTSLLSFSMTGSSSSSADIELETSNEDSQTNDIAFKLSVFSVYVGYQFTGDSKTVMTHGKTASWTRAQSNTIQVTLGDQDPGDEFKVEIYRDTVFGGPVYKLVGGRSRCPHETGTISREKIGAKFQLPTIVHANPFSTLSTVLTLSNQSPTHETMQYFINTVDEYNSKGLSFFINGRSLDSNVYVHNFIVNVNYDQDVELTVVITKGANGFDFPDNSLYVSVVSGGYNGAAGGYCSAVYVPISVFYDQNCNQVAFGGPIAVNNNFLVNAANTFVDSNGVSAPILHIVISNPEYGQLQRSWLSNYASAFLQSVQIQYQAYTPGQALSDVLWTPITQYGSTTKLDVLQSLNNQFVSSGDDNHELLEVSWDLSGVIDGLYALRAITKCRQPVGAADSSYYTYSTPVVYGQVSVKPPKVFGSPLPQLVPYLPGKSISVKFDKVITCNSYFGHTRLYVWVNPTALPGLQSDGQNVPATYLCIDNVISIELVTPIWDNLVGRLLTARLENIFDTTGNALANPVQWSFSVANFNTKQSSVSVSNLMLNKPVSWIIANTAFTTASKVQAQLQRELVKLINADVAASFNGLVTGSIVFSSIVDTATQAALNFDIIDFPLFPSDIPSPYSPSFFVNHFQSALNLGSYTNATQFPLLSHLLYTSGVSSVSFTVNPITSTYVNALSLGRSMNLMNVKPYSNFRFVYGVSQQRTTLQLTWQSDMAFNLRSQDLDITYWDEQTADVIHHINVKYLKLVQNVQSEQAVYVLVIDQLPPVITSSINLHVEVKVISQSTSLLYMISEILRLIGPPTAPQIVECKQGPTLHQLQLSVASAASDQAHQYEIYLTTETGATFTLPRDSFSQSSIDNALINFAVDLLSSSIVSLGIIVPPADSNAQWNVGIIAIASQDASVAQSSISNKSLLVYGPPPNIRIINSLQHSLQMIEIQFEEPAVPILSYLVSFRVTSADPNSPLTVDSHEITHVSTPGNGTLPAILSHFIIIPANLLPCSMLELSVSAHTSFGVSTPSFVRLATPLFVEAPHNVSVSIISAASESSRYAVVSVTWAASTQDNVLGYQVSYTYTDGATLINSNPHPYQFGPDAVSAQIQVFYVPSPIAGTSTVYFITVAAILSNTYNNVLFFDRPLYSSVSSVSFPFYLNTSEGAAQDIEYSLEGSLQASAPAAPEQLQVRFIGINRVRVSFAAVVQAHSYIIQYFDASSNDKFPIGNKIIGNVMIDGMVSTFIDDGFFHALSSARLIKFSVSASDATGLTSQHRIKYLRIEPTISDNTQYSLQLNNGLRLTPNRDSEYVTVDLAYSNMIEGRFIPESSAVRSIRYISSASAQPDTFNLFSACSALDIYTAMPCNDYSIKVQLTPLISNYLYVEVTAESGIVSYSTIELKVQGVSALSVLARADENADVKVAKLTPPFQTGVFQYAITLPNVYSSISLQFAATALNNITVILDGVTLHPYSSGVFDFVPVGTHTFVCRSTMLGDFTLIVNRLSCSIQNVVGVAYVSNSNSYENVAVPQLPWQNKTAIITVPYSRSSIQLSAIFTALPSSLTLNTLTIEIISNRNMVNTVVSNQSVTFTLDVSSNTFRLLSSQDGAFNLTVVRASPASFKILPLASNPSFSVSVATVPQFSSDIFSYTISVVNQFNSISFSLLYSTATLATINGTAIGSGVTSPPYSLIPNNPTSFVFGSENGRYTIVVTRQSPNVKSIELRTVCGTDSLIALTFSPAFVGGVTSYSGALPFSATSLSVNVAFLTAGSVTLVGSNETIQSGVMSSSLNINGGVMTLVIQSSFDGAYTFILSKPNGTLSNLLFFSSSADRSPILLLPSFSPFIFTYSLIMPVGVNSLLYQLTYANELIVNYNSKDVAKPKSGDYSPAQSIANGITKFYVQTKQSATYTVWITKAV